MSTQEVEADWSGAAARSLEMTFTFQNVVCNGGRKLNTLQKIANCDDICHDRLKDFIEICAEMFFHYVL